MNLSAASHTRTERVCMCFGGRNVRTVDVACMCEPAVSRAQLFSCFSQVLRDERLNREEEDKKRKRRDEVESESRTLLLRSKRSAEECSGGSPFSILVSRSLAGVIVFTRPQPPSFQFVPSKLLRYVPSTLTS